MGRYNPWAMLAVILLHLTACAPQEQAFHDHPRNQAYLDGVAFHTSDGISLPYEQWSPAHKIKAIIVAIHGFNDYSNAFAYSGNFFKQHGIALYAYDQRGFGDTDHVGIWANAENLARDLKQFVLQIQSQHPGAPVYVLGESMGGAVAIIAAADPDFPPIDGLILSAPAVWGEDTMNPLYRSTLWLAAHTFPYRKLTGSELKIIACSNTAMLRSMAYDPLVIKATRVDAIYGLVHLMDSAYQHVPDVHVPMLLLYGAHDQVIPSSPITSARLRFTEPFTYAYYPDGYHMLLRDIRREIVMSDIASWIAHPNRALPSGFEDSSAPEEYDE